MDLEDDGGIDFADGWQAIVSRAGEGAVELQGTAADELKPSAETPVPFLSADLFLQAALQGDVYYTLIGVGPSLSSPTSATGFRFGGNLDGALGMAVFATKSGTLARVSRFPSLTNRGYLWLLEPSLEGELAEVQLPFQGGEALFELPNGLFGYAVINAAGARLAELPVGVVDSVGTSTGAVVGAGCAGCHFAGVLPALDEVGGADLSPFVERDNAAYLQARARIDLGTRRNSLTEMFFDFQYQPVTSRVAAADLGVTPNELLGSLAGLDAALAPLGAPGGAVDRSLFLSRYRTSLCLLQQGAENAPTHCENSAR